MFKLIVMGMVMEHLKPVFLSFLFFFLFAAAAEGKVYIDIDAPSGKKLPLAIQEFTELDEKPADLNAFEEAKKELSSALSYDLDFSGLFDVIGKEAYLESPASAVTDFSLWRAIGAEMLIKGKIRIKENTLTVELRLFDAVRETQLFARRYVGLISNPRIIAHRFSDDLMEALTEKPGIFSTKIAFISDKTGKREVWIADYDGKNPRKITSNGSINLSPQWSPDGKKILYTSYMKGSPILYAQDLASGAVEAVSDTEGLNIAGRWSPDGKKIALTLSGKTSPELYILELDSKNYIQLTSNYAIDTSPSFSPDGKKLAFVSDMGGNPNIYVIDLESKNLKRLTFGGKYNTEPAWSPDGKSIAFSRQDNGNFNIWVMRENGKEQTELTFEGDNKSPSWSADNRYIVFQSRDKKGENSLFIIHKEGGGKIKIDPGPGSETFPAWSPSTVKGEK